MIAILSSPDVFQNKTEMDKIRTVIKEQGEGVIHYEVRKFPDIGEALSRFNQCNVDAIVIIGGQALSSAVFEYLVDKKPFGDRVVPVSVLAGDEVRFVSQSFGAYSAHVHEDLSMILNKHKLGTLLNSQVKTPLIKIEGVRGVGKLYGLYFCTGEIVSRKHLFQRTLYRSGIRQTIQNYMTILSLLYKAYLGSKRSDDVSKMIRVNRNQRGAVVGQYFMVLLSSLDWVFLGTKLPEKKKPNTINFLSVENTKDAIMATGRQLLKGQYSDAMLHGHVITEIEHARLVFNKHFVVDGCFYETDQSDELLISMADELTFIRLD